MYASHSKQDGHSRACKVGVIITNLGSPSSPTKAALKRYLAEFLSDPRVVEVPRWLWWLILNGVILQIRPGRSAKTYAKIWTEKGSPLSFIMADLKDKLEKKLKSSLLATDNLVVDFAMRYGKPGIERVVKDMQAQGVQRLIVLPLYPQYSGSTTASTFDEFARVLSTLRWQPSLDFLPPYYDHPHFVETIAQSITDYRAKNGSGELLVFSYHGVPQRYLHKGDPYHCQCLKTSRLVLEKLEIPEAEARTYFQSRFGREPWLQPYMDLSLEELAQQGYKNIDIICPGFSIDCLETLEEVKMEAQQAFVDAGGETLNYIPCLNDSKAHVKLLQHLLTPSIKNHMEQILQPEKNLLCEEAIQALEAKSPNKQYKELNTEKPSSAAKQEKPRRKNPELEAGEPK